MKKILFPTFNRVHEARQKLLLNELAKDFEIHVTTYGEKDLDMANVAVDIASKFQNALNTIKPDLALLRGDRFEMLVPAMLCAYNRIPIAHIEGFDLSGAIDNKVRYAVSYLSDYHFVTNDESYRRALAMGFNNVWNFGSLDCEYAMEISGVMQNKPYVVVLYHQVPNERPGAVLEALEPFKNDYQIFGIKSNRDYGQSTYKEEYAPNEFIRLLRGAKCLIGNSSAGIKEASVLCLPVVNIGERQANRVKPPNVKDCKCEKQDIEYAIKYQLDHRYPISTLYYKPYASKNISEIIKSLI